MAGSFSDYLELELLDHVLGAAAYTPPVNVYVALFTVAPDDTGAGTEVTGGDYARVEVVNNSTNWPAAAGATATKSNGTAVNFVTATGDWTTVVAFGIFDDPTAGNLLVWGDITPNQAIPSGITATFDVGTLVVTLD